MMDYDMAERLAALEALSESNVCRLDKLEHDHELLTRMTTAIEVMATKQEIMVERVETIDHKVTEMERTPSRRLQTVIGHLATAVVSAGGVWLAEHWIW